MIFYRAEIEFFVARVGEFFGARNGVGNRRLHGAERRHDARRETGFTGYRVV